jgi:hypothetical protein
MMAYAQLINGVWIENGVFSPGWIAASSPQVLANAGLVEIVEDVQPAPAGAIFVGTQLVDVGGAPARWGVYDVLDLEVYRAQRLAELAALRWSKQQFVSFMGRQAPADDVTLGRVMAAVMRAQIAQNPNADVRWKFGENDFVTLTVGDITNYGMVIGTQMRACFDNEDVLSAAIAEAADTQSLAEINLETGWPE